MNTMLRQSITALLLATSLTVGSATADTLIIEGIDAPASNNLARGMSQATVEARLGPPVSNTITSSTVLPNADR
jgi:hypothetical protein